MLVTSRSAIYLGRWGSLIVHAHKLSCAIRGKQITYDKPSTLNSWATWIATDCCVKCMNNRFLKCKVTHWAGCIVALSAVLGQHAKVCLSVLHSHYCTTTIWTRPAIWLHPVHKIAVPISLSPSIADEARYWPKSILQCEWLCITAWPFF